MPDTPKPGSDFSGKIALVTGAGRGLGRGCATALAAAGAKVFAVARTAADLDTVAAETDGTIEPWVADVGDDDFCRRVESLDRLDILVNNAGTNRPQPFVDVTPENLDAMIALNVRTAFRVAQSAARVMLACKAEGVVINMSSQMGHIGAANRTVYCMTKHAIEGLTKAMAVELAPHGIRVNSVAPTFIDTPMVRPMLDDPQFKRSVLDMIPVGRIGTVDEVVGAVMYLASPAAAMITGHSLRVDGGWTAH